MSIILCGDTHLRADEPYFSAFKQFTKNISGAEWNTPENVFIHMGDFFNSSALSGELVDQAKEFWDAINCDIKMIIQGNHDVSRRLGSSLLSLPKDVAVIYKDKSMTVNGVNILLLPHPELLEDRERYQQLTGKYDLILGHFAALPLFGHELVLSPDLISPMMFFGHVHIQDKSNDCYIGVPLATMYGEDCQKNRLIKIDEKTLTYENIYVESTLKSAVVDWNKPEQIEAAKKMKDTPVLMDVINAPSVKSVYEHLPESQYYIRRIEVKQDMETPELASAEVIEQGRSFLINEFFNQSTKTEEVNNRVRQLLVNEGN